MHSKLTLHYTSCGKQLLNHLIFFYLENMVYDCTKKLTLKQKMRQNLSVLRMFISVKRL